MVLHKPIREAFAPKAGALAVALLMLVQSYPLNINEKVHFIDMFRTVLDRLFAVELLTGEI